MAARRQRPAGRHEHDLAPGDPRPQPSEPPRSACPRCSKNARPPRSPARAPSLAGLFRAYSGLSTHGWQLIGAAIEQIEHGSPVAARFARANVALYIESVYDAHFGLAQVGKQLVAGYKTLGGASAFGPSLTQAEVDRLAGTYSEASDRLHPHPGVKLGS